MREEKLTMETVEKKPDAAGTSPKTEREIIDLLQKRVEAMERREAERRVRTIKCWCIACVVLVILVLIAMPRVRTAARTLEEVSATVQHYSSQLKALDPGKLQDAIQFINNLDIEALNDAGKELENVSLDKILTQFGTIESVAGDQSELKTAISIIGTAIGKVAAGYQ